MSEFKKGDRIELVGYDRLPRYYSTLDYSVRENRMATIKNPDYSSTQVEVFHASGSLKYWEKQDIKKLGEANMFEVGQVLVRSESDYTKRVVGIVGEVVFTQDSDDGNLGYTHQDELAEKWSVKTEEEPTELSIDQIAEKFNLDPSQVRIKKED